MSMSCEVRREGEVVTFILGGEIYENDAATLKSQFTGLPLSEIKELVLDFGGVTYIGSSAIGKMLIFYKQLAAHHAKMRLSNTPETIAALFRALKLNGLFPVEQENVEGW